MCRQHSSQTRKTADIHDTYPAAVSMSSSNGRNSIINIRYSARKDLGLTIPRKGQT
jgi:hypothetical protein